MTKEEYQAKHGPELAAFLRTEAGKEYLPTLFGMRPAATPQATGEQMLHRLGSIDGYERCLINSNELAMKPAQPKIRVEPTYPEPKLKEETKTA